MILNIIKSYTATEFAKLTNGREIIPLKEIDDYKRVGCLTRIDVHQVGNLQIIFAGYDKIERKFVIQHVK